ncbi:hypothetical protein OH784_07375 [Ectobacillus funiculus]|uniref:hypothetical protein n=1 Tax=Ectobacillus funiculus TaxID=137993 RepID=UPI0039799B90
MGYVFEYFNNYLGIEALEEQAVFSNERLTKYRKQLEQYDEEVQDWLIGIYANHDKQSQRSMINKNRRSAIFIYQRML